ncbi:MAG: archaellin/type IV pilin N-terminal domain-containing protein [Nitrososphaerota archaeon]|nr:flagellin [Candidatus Bathyarchaeota archaeon]MDW8023091.1 archaellin/type IV pilin N-terminal domain-containing protein [Nitrososphaerota archaeon]
MQRLFKNRRGIVGVEAAIVLIAFIIVAAALSYVVINMGFYTTQKTKEVMQSGLEESLCALQLDGSISAKTNNQAYIEWIILPVKLSAGRGEIDLKNGSLVASVYLPNATLLNIYNGAYLEAKADCDILIQNLSQLYKMNETDMAMFALYNHDGDTCLEPTEKAFLVIHLNSTVAGLPGARHTVADYEVFKVEVKGAKGAALSVVRTAPGGMPQNAYIDLG